jgi:hypothetical protein
MMDWNQSSDADRSDWRNGPMKIQIITDKEYSDAQMTVTGAEELLTAVALTIK